MSKRKQITLPSGEQVIVRPITFEAFLMIAELPDFLTGDVEKLIAGESLDYGDESGELTIDEYRQYVGLMTKVFGVCVVDPEIVEEDPGEEEGKAWVYDYTLEDWAYVFSLLNKPIEQLRSFRPESHEDMEPVRAGEGDQPGTV
jgi:hypothetical protein